MFIFQSLDLERRLIRQKNCFMKSAIFHSINLPFGAQVAEKILNVIYNTEEGWHMLLVTFFSLAIRLRPFILHRNFGSDFVVKHKEKGRHAKKPHTTTVIIRKKYKKILHRLVYPFNFWILLYVQDLWLFDVVKKRYSSAYR